MTIKEIAPILNVKPASLKKRLERQGFGKFGLSEELPKEIKDSLFPPPKHLDQVKNKVTRVPELEEVDAPKPKIQKPIPVSANKQPIVPKVDPVVDQEPEPVPTRKKNNFAFYLTRIPLLMLAIGAGYGVYHFSQHFAPKEVAAIVGLSFEMVYIGIAAFSFKQDKDRERAQRVALGAVLVSVIFNAISGVFYVRPEWFELLKPWQIWTLAIIHGVPMAILNYQYASLIIHTEE